MNDAPDESTFVDEKKELLSYWKNRMGALQKNMTYQKESGNVIQMYDYAELEMSEGQYYYIAYLIQQEKNPLRKAA